MRIVVLFVLMLCLSASAQTQPATKVGFRGDGIALVNGKPFFPIGIWVYAIDSNVLAEIHEHQFNAVIGNSVAPEHLDLLAQRGLMAVPMAGDAFVQRSRHPALLAWYLSDEP